MIKSYLIEYKQTQNKDVPEQHRNYIVQHETIFASNKKEVDIVINFLYPLIVNSDEWVIQAVFVKSPTLEKEGKIKYLY